jgi:hypothetical protein
LDFWDLTVIIFRRWKVSLPLLLLAVGATAFVAVTAKPDYTMTSYVQLIPARVAPTDNPANAALRNPWNQLGVYTLGQAAIYATQDHEFLESLEAAKHTDNFTLTMTQPNPIVTVEVVGSTRADARATTELVIARLRGLVQSLQTGAGVQDKDIIATHRLDGGQNLEAAAGKVKRAVAAVAVAGLLVMAGGALGFDAFARRRARKRQEREQIESSLQDGPSTGAANGNDPVLPGRPGASQARPLTAVKIGKSAQRQASEAARSSDREQRTAIVVKRSALVARRSSAAKPTRPGEAGTYMSMNAHGEAEGDDHDGVPPATNGDAAAIPSDVRTVLKPKRVGGENGGKSQ